MAPPRRRTRSTGMSPGAMGGKIGSPVTSRPKPSTMSPGERKARTGFAAPKKDLAKQFFKGPVSDDRLRRRLQQDREERDFISTLKPAGGSPTNLLQEQAPTFNPMTGQYERTTLAQKRQQLANLYGPTLSEIGSDIGYGLGSIGSALGQKVMAGEFGLMGIAKGLYEQFTNSAAKAKDALVQGVNKLSDIDLEFLKNEEKYPQMSSHPRVQGIKDIEEYQMTELDKANLIKENMERVSTNVLEKDNTVQSAKVFDDSFRRLPGSGYQAGAGLPAIANQEDNYIKIQNGQAVPISKEEFLEDQRAVEEDFANDPFFADKMTKTSNQMNIAPGFEIVTDYKSPEARMQELIEKNKVNNTNMFDLGINNAKNQLSELERVFGVDMQ